MLLVSFVADEVMEYIRLQRPEVYAIYELDLTLKSALISSHFLVHSDGYGGVSKRCERQEEKEDFQTRVHIIQS